LTVPSNTLRSEPGKTQKSVKPGRQEKSAAGSAQETPSFFWRNPAFQTGAGTMVLFLNLVWLIALVSYTMTWREDQSLFLETSWKSLWTADAEAQNWLGRLGAFLGHWTVYRGWGLGVVFLWFWTLLLGLKLLFSDFKVKLVERAFDALFFASIVSVTLAFLFHACWTLPFPWGGAFGRFAVGWASGFVGLVGTGLALSGFLVCLADDTPGQTLAVACPSPREGLGCWCGSRARSKGFGFEYDAQSAGASYPRTSGTFALGRRNSRGTNGR